MTKICNSLIIFISLHYSPMCFSEKPAEAIEIYSQRTLGAPVSLYQFRADRFDVIDSVNISESEFILNLLNESELLIINGYKKPIIAEQLESYINNLTYSDSQLYKILSANLNRLKYNANKEVKFQRKNSLFVVGWKSEYVERCFERIIKIQNEYILYSQLTFDCNSYDNSKIESFPYNSELKRELRINELEEATRYKILSPNEKMAVVEKVSNF